MNVIKNNQQGRQLTMAVDQEEADVVVKSLLLHANGITHIDYKDTELLKRFISERGKILPRRVTGTSLNINVC